MKIAQLAGLVSMSVLLRLYLKGISIKLILISALIVVHAQMFALLRLFIPNNPAILKGIWRAAEISGSSCLFWIIPGFFHDGLNIRIFHKIGKCHTPVVPHIRFNNPESQPDRCPARRFIGEIACERSLIG